MPEEWDFLMSFIPSFSVVPKLVFKIISRAVG
jgi:hypothetical protein